MMRKQLEKAIVHLSEQFIYSRRSDYIIEKEWLSYPFILEFQKLVLIQINI